MEQLSHWNGETEDSVNFSAKKLPHHPLKDKTIPGPARTGLTNSPLLRAS